MPDAKAHAAVGGGAKSCVLDCDFHTHTGYSDDCDFSMDDMLRGTVARGIKTLAITDHHDPGYPDPEFPFQLDFPGYFQALQAAKEEYAGRLEVLYGMEIGIMAGKLDEASRAVNSFPFDVIIGSFHCMRNADMYRYDFSHADIPSELEDFYTYAWECLKKFNDYDILGHLTILDRYIGEIYDYSVCRDQIDAILRLAVERGKGLEINTSSFKYGTPSWLPRESVLTRYRELGGEILTFGSDAHDPAYYQYHFNDAVEFAKSLGFRYYCEFRQRNPVFKPLP